jgi:anti-anti-sigma factor
MLARRRRRRPAEFAFRSTTPASSRPAAVLGAAVLPSSPLQYSRHPGLLGQGRERCVSCGMPGERRGRCSAAAARLAEPVPIHRARPRDGRTGHSRYHTTLVSLDRPGGAIMQASFSAQSDKVVIRLEGRFDFNTHREFRDTSDAALKSEGVQEIQIDLGAVDYLDSSALGMLLMLRDRARNAGKSVTLANCRGSVRQVLDIANFGKLFAIS